MKKVLALLLTVALLCTVCPLSALAFDSTAVYAGVPGCQLTSLELTQVNNAWLLWDVDFTSSCDGRVLETTNDHPNLIGRTVIPTFAFEGDRVTFNGLDILSDTDSVILEEKNELVVYGNNTKAEYEVFITEVTNGLPVVLIDTDNLPILNKTDYVTTSISILGGDVDYAKDVYAAVGGIKLRGNSTMGYDKKPYRIKFEKKQNVLGMGKAKSWTLIANYLDPAFIRNEISYSFVSRLNAMTGASRADGFVVFAPRMRPVEVYLNGVYVGLYDMGDHIQANELRVAIDEDEDADGNILGTIDTGYFIEVEDSSRVIPEYESEGTPYFTVDAGVSDPLYFQFKLPELPTQEQMQYIQNYMQNVSNLLIAKSADVWNYIDMDSFIDWYLANELFKNTDSALLSSCYFFKDKGGLLKMGPVWDFDLSAGAVSYSDLSNPTGWRTRSSENAVWFENLFSMPVFANAVNQRWQDLHDNGIIDGLFSDITDYSARVADAATRNYEKWQNSYVSAVNATSWLAVPSTLLNSDRWEKQVQYVRSFLLARVNWMDQQFGYAESLDYVNLLSNTTVSSTQTIPIGKSFDVTQLNNMYLTVTSNKSFNITFNFDVGSPSLSSDWEGTDATKYPFVGTTGAAIAAGTYTDVALNLTDFMPYSSNPGATTITLNSIAVTPSGGGRVSIQIPSLYAAAEPQSSLTDGLSGVPTVWGVPEVGTILTADTNGVLPYQTSVSYQWNRNGVAIAGATGSTYTLADADLGNDVTLTVTGRTAVGSLTTDAVTIVKKQNTYKTTQVPVLVSKTADTVVIQARTGYEYRIDGGEWQATTTFTDLLPNTCYRVYYRHAPTATAQGGVQGNPLYVVTDLGTPVVTGDVNGDGSVNTSDAKIILSYAMGQVQLTASQIASADINGDGEVNTIDVRAMLAKLVNG